MKTGPVAHNLILAGIVAGTLAASVAVRLVWPDARWVYEPLHSEMEALGGLAAVTMSFVLLQRMQEPGGRKFESLAMGFLGMGLLEEFHAITPMSDGTVLLRGLASLFGGIGFVLVWLPGAGRERAWARWMPWTVAGACVAFGLWTLASPGHVPPLMRDGEFTATAVAPKSVASMLFIAGAVRFLRDFRRSGKSEEYLFACLGFLFGSAEFMFTYSAIWDGGWWFWHGLRLLTYVLVLGYVSRGYLRIVSELTGALTQTRRAEEGLRAALEDRERLARDLHDGIIQSIYAIGLSLAECRRLVVKDAPQAVTQLGEAIADLNVVIRDVRNYIGGLEAEIASGKELEAALVSLVRTMEGAHTVRFSLQVDQAAADQIAPSQAVHLLYIAKEAMSNSLRHSNARNGLLSLRLADGCVRLTVEDDGAGFNTGETAEQGHGLRNIQARAREIGARCSVQSLSGQGTRVILDIPLEVMHA